MKKRKKRISSREILNAYDLHGSVRRAARALDISKDKVWRTVRDHRGPKDPISPGRKGQFTDVTNGDSRMLTGEGISSLDELLEKAGVDSDDWVVTRQKHNSWEALGKDSEVVTLRQVTAHLERTPSFFIQPVDPVDPLPRVPRETESAKRCALIVPDIQAGFRRIEDNSQPGGYRWEPLHDRKAMDAVLQIAEKMKDQIDTVVYLGDNLDLSPWSTRWLSDVSTLMTTNASLRELYQGFMVPLRKILPHSHQIYVAGNHERRIEDCLTAKLGEAVGLRTADKLDGPGLLDIKTLLALDSIECEYISPYGKPYWLYDQIKIFHGNIARKGSGSTTSAYLQTATESMIWGHTHRLEMGQVRRATPDGYKIFTAASPGCLCRAEIGVVPGVLGTTPDWQQGVGVVYEHDGRHSIQLIPIQGGVAFLNGEVIVGRGIDEDWAERTGLPF